MASHSRRDFLKMTGVGVVGLTAIEWPGPSGAATSGEVGRSMALPGHRSLAVPGVHAYPLDTSVRAGEALELCVSASTPYRLSICRLGLEIDDPSSDEVLAVLNNQPTRPIPIHPGSYIHVDKGLAPSSTGWTLECWVRLATDRIYAGLITQYDYKETCGIGLFAAPGGVASLYLGDGKAYRNEWALRSDQGVLKPGHWHHVVGTWDGRQAALWVDGKRVAQRDHSGAVSPGSAPLRLGGYGEDGVAGRFLDGDLAMPVIYNAAIDSAAIAKRFADQGLTAATGKNVLGCWPLTEEKGDHVTDISEHERHGQIINHATWMIGGPSFEAEVTRFGEYNPAADPKRGHGLRFASDDLYDCRWPVAHRWGIPEDARPGLHVARFEFEYDGQQRVSDVTFLVRRSANQPKPPILVLASSNTWRAYGGTPFAMTRAKQMNVWGTGGLPGAARGLPSFDFYREHAAGQGTYQVGLRMPWPAAGPGVLYGGATGYSHLMRADRFTHVWLEKNGYDFDVVTGLDLHRDPEMLKDYRVFVINGHSEYWSLPMYKGVESYLGDDGRLLVLSGNSMGWRVSFNDEGTVMECRKVDAAGTQMPPSRRGEAWHSQDGLRGGLLRECGYPGYRLIALDIIGFINPSNPKNYGPYVAERTDHPFFHEPEETGIKQGDKFGWAGPGQVPMINGHEMDIRPSTFAALQEEPTPEGAVMPEDPPGITRLANGIVHWSEGGTASDYFHRHIHPTDQGGEMIDWHRTDGGRVFNAGAIGSGWTLDVDPRWAAMVRNVLYAFGVSRPTGKG